MNSCKDCKFFKKFEKESFYYKKYENKYGECNCNKFEYEDDYDYKKAKEIDKLLYQDYEGYSASFIVGEEFGCIHYKKV